MPWEEVRQATENTGSGFKFSIHLHQSCVALGVYLTSLDLNFQIGAQGLSLSSKKKKKTLEKAPTLVLGTQPLTGTESASEDVSAHRHRGWNGIE